MARKLFPDMPTEVIAAWLVDPIRSHGWPPNGFAWECALRGESTEFWARLDWERRAILPDFSKLSMESQRIVRQIIDAYFYNQINEVGRYMGEQGRQKLQEILRHVGETGKLPSVLIVLETGGFFEVVDGCHRLAVYFHTLWTGGESLVTHPAEVWIAIPKGRQQLGE